MGKIRSTGQTGQPAGAAPTRVDPQIDSVLANWGRWAAPGRGTSGAASLWRFAGRGDRSAAYYGAAVVVPVDVGQALQVERVVCNPGFSELFRGVLRAHYVAELAPQRTCRELGLHLEAYEQWVWRASVFFADRWVPLQRASLTA